MNNPSSLQKVLDNQSRILELLQKFIQKESRINWDQILFLILGAIITLVGTAIAKVFSFRWERKQEINSIKIGLNDEISENAETIKQMLKTQEEAKFLSQNYVDTLLKNRVFFESVANRLFLINNKGLRKDLRNFYKNLEKNADNCLKSKAIGSLNESDTKQKEEVTKIVVKFTKLQTFAEDLKKKIEKYHYKVFFIF